MHNKGKYNLIKILINVLILFALILPGPGLLSKPAYAECPKGISKDSQRLKKYITQINAYLAEAEGIVKAATGDGAKEYLGEAIWDILAPDCPAFLQNERDKLGDRIIASSGKEQAAYDAYIASGLANGQLAADISASWVLAYTKVGESPYPLGDRSAQRTSTAYAQALKTYDNQVAGYLMQYLFLLQRRLATELTWNSPAKAPEELFKRAKEAVGYVYEINRQLKNIDYDIALARKNYEREDEIYSIYVDYYNNLYHAFSAKAKDYTFSSPDRSSWVSLSQTFQRIGWNSALASAEMFWHSFDQGTKAWISQESPFFPNPLIRQVYIGNPFSPPDFGGVRIVKTDLNQVKARLRNKIPPTNEDELLMLVDKGAGIYAAANQLFDAYKPLEQGLVTSLNAVLEKYRADFPYTKPYALEERSVVNSLGIDYTVISISACEYPTTSNQPPTAVPKVDAMEKKIPEAFKLDATGSTDPENDKLSYEWIITQIPETEETKATSLVLYQRFKGEKIDFKLDPQNDPAGDWVIKLIASDGKKSAEKEIILKATRRILWISHSDEDITLRLYTPTPQTLPQEIMRYARPYMVEASHENARVYQNYNDDGMPVDEDSGYTPPTGKDEYCFSINRDSYDSRLDGAYDGLYGSTNMITFKYASGEINTNIYHKAPGTFELVSASRYDMYAPFLVKVLDQKITHLVLPSQDCPYGQHLDQAKKGTYEITQWIDYSKWINDHESAGGEGFLEMPGANGVPDWLEKMAAEALNNDFPEALPYVRRFELTEKPNESDSYYNTLNEVVIYLNPTSREIRYSLPYLNNGYGFYAPGGESIVKHEAHHALYTQAVRGEIQGKRDPIAYPDKDADGFPGATAISSRFFQYMLDTQDNPYGRYGPRKISDSNGIQTDYRYVGEGEPDPWNVKSIMFHASFPKGAIPSELTFLPPARLPIRDYFTEIYIIMSKAGKGDKLDLLEGVHFEQNVVDASGIQPKLIIKLKPAFEEELRRQGRLGYSIASSDGKVTIYVNTKLQLPSLCVISVSAEFDASLIQGATYVGNWGRVKRMGL